MNVLHKLVAILIFILLLHFPTFTAQANHGDTHEVVANSLHIRDTPSTQGKIVGSLKRGNTLEVFKEESGWVQTYYNGKEVWVASNYLHPIEPRGDNILLPTESLIDYTVVIDPGHGGKDPGAIGHNGIREKDVILSTSLKVAEKLRALGFSVVLTRTSDQFVSLDKRIEISNTNNSDAFISIHYNSFSMDYVGGFNTHYFSPGDSHELAKSIHTSLAKYVQLRDRGIARDGYRVLRNNQGPAVLVELGFITNTNEVLVVQSEDFQSRAAEAIANGVKEFLLR